jgi:acetylglutamate kinase
MSAQGHLPFLLEAVSYISKYVGTTFVVKLGGSVGEGSDTVLQDVSVLWKLGIRIVLVHGGGQAISSWLQRVGKEPKFLHGLRVTDAETLEVVTMVLAGKINTEAVVSLQRQGLPAIGLTGADGALFEACPLAAGEELGLVGNVVRVNPAPVKAVLEAGYIPVVAPLGYNAELGLMNVNADTAAGELAAAMAAEKAIFLTDVDGVLDADGHLISILSESQVVELISNGVISGGMIPKVEACLRALDGARSAHIINGRVPNALLLEVLTQSGIGTMIRK